MISPPRPITPVPATQPRVYALIPSAGSGSRAGGNVPKQYQMLNARPMLAHTLEAFAGCARINMGILILAPEDNHAKALLPQLPLGVFQAHWVGGENRAQSVLGGLYVLQQAGAQENDWVLVHDAARCLIQAQSIQALLDACWDDPVGGLLAQPLSDTLKQAQPFGRTCNTSKQAQPVRVLQTVARDDKWLAQTPQMFRLGLLLQALQAASPQATDEASAIESLGLQPRLVQSGHANFKVTYPQDFAQAQALLQQRSQASTTTLRIGEGFDVHALVDTAASGRTLILGGIEIPFDKALAGHSDADVLLHAITDALLGAAALGDIGRHFPDTDAVYQGADSRVLLQLTVARVKKAGFAIANVDATLIAEAPKLAPYMEKMISSVARCIGVEVSQVNIKAKTAEKLGPVGEGLSMEARAVVLLAGEYC